jgi:hypothetical protein
MENDRGDGEERRAAQDGSAAYSPSHPDSHDSSSNSSSDDNGEEPMDWSSNLGGIKKLLDSTGGQLPEGPAASASAEAGTSDEQAGSMPPPPPPPPPPASTSTPRSLKSGSASTVPFSISTESGTTLQAVPPPDVMARAKEFIKVAAEKKMAAIQEALGEDNLAYEAIKKANLKKHRLKDLKTGDMMTISDKSSMITTLDGRMRIVEVDVMLGQKLTWTYSFSLRTAECIGCKQHVNVTPFPRRGSQIRGGRQAIWLSDQSVPPVLPSSSQTLQCVKIVRLEGGMLQELAEGLVRALSGRKSQLAVLFCLPQ